jgi:adenylate cyclase
MERRLAAILAADVVGYSRLMGADEMGTLNALKSHCEELVQPRVTANNGRIFKMMGDGLLAEFASVVDAVTCAAEIQRAMPERNRDLPDDRHIVFRIGVNLGDVILDGEDIFGDGVNVAARLEGLADPGGICISGPAFDVAEGKTELAFEDVGAHQVKNIAKPVRVYRAMLAGGRPAAISPSRPVSKAAPDKPAIAVLPFLNMSGDPEQEYFADGITEDIITELSRYRDLLVIARNSVFAYKGRVAGTEQIARELGVGYVVEGSVRKAGQRVRVTVQLVDAETGNQVWTERYDRELTDIFELQDELTQNIAAVLPRRLESAEVSRSKRKLDCDIGVYDFLIRAKLCHHRGSREDNVEGLRLIEKAIEIDPEFAPALGWRACILGQAAARGYIALDKEVEGKIYQEILAGLSIDDNDLECTRILCEFRIEYGQLDEALVLSDKLLRLNPNDPRLLAQRSEIMTWLGRPEDGLDWVQQAMRLDPHDADTWAHHLGRALFGMGRYEDCVAAFKRPQRQRAGHRAFMAACFALMGDKDRAAAEAREVLHLQPDFTAQGFGKTLFYQNDADRRKVRDALVAAGLPD